MDKKEIEQKMVTKLNTLSVASTGKLFTIYYKDVRLTLANNKCSWVSLGAVKNALRSALPNVGYHKDRLAVIKDLEEKGIITYKEI